MTKKGNILLRLTLSLCSVDSAGTLCFFAVLSAVLAGLSFCRPFAAARVLPFILWMMLAWLALFGLEAGWRMPKWRKPMWGFALASAAACPVLAHCIRMDRLAGAGAGIFCGVFALMTVRSAVRRSVGTPEKIYLLLLLLIYGGACALAFFSFGYHFEAAARRYAVLFAAAALECLARLFQYFFAGRNKTGC